MQNSPQQQEAARQIEQSIAASCMGQFGVRVRLLQGDLIARHLLSEAQISQFDMAFDSPDELGEVANIIEKVSDQLPEK